MYNFEDGNSFAICTADGDQVAPHISRSVVWQDNRNGNWDIYGQFIDGDTVTGKFTGSDFAIADSASLHSYNVDLAFDEDTAKFLVVWHDDVGSGSKHINGQFVNTASAPS